MTRDYERARDIEDAIDDQDERLVVAFRKFTTTLADVDDPDGEIGMIEATFRAVDRFEHLEERVDELESENQMLRHTVEQLTDIGEEKSTKEEKIAAIVTWAQRQAADETADRVAVTARDIVGVTGVSRRYAYDLIDDLPGEYDWLLDRSRVSQYGDLEIDQDGQTRAVIVDCEQLHEDDAAVNKFTTATSQKEVAD